jgi:hypothetical protein
MRWVMLVAVSAVTTGMVGCDEAKKAAGINKEEKPKGQSVSLPKSTAKLRADTMDVYSSYSFKDPAPKHPNEGKRVLFKASGVAHGVKTDGLNLILEGSGNLVRRPRVVHHLKSDTGFHTGEYPGSPWIEGTLRGLVEYASKPWAKDWLKLTKEDGLGDRFIFVEDAILVADPD